MGDVDELMANVEVAISLTTDQLTDAELAAIYSAAYARFDPCRVLGYEKARSLFTEENGKYVHAETLRALGAIVYKRLGERK